MSRVDVPAQVSWRSSKTCNGTCITQIGPGPWPFPPCHLDYSSSTRGGIVGKQLNRVVFLFSFLSFSHIVVVQTSQRGDHFIAVHAHDNGGGGRFASA